MSAELRKLKCKSCKQCVGITDEVFLYGGAMAFPFPVSFKCVHCGALNKWRPVAPRPVPPVLVVETPLPIGASRERNV